MDMEACPVCSLVLPRSEIQVHCNQHFETASQAQRIPCSQCGLQLTLEELDSHELAHSLQDESAPGAASQVIQQPPSSSNHMAVTARQAGQKRGRCFACGEEGHFKADCPSRPEAPPAPPRSTIQPAHADIIAARQQPDAQSSRPEDIIKPLQACLHAQCERLPGHHYRAALAGMVTHFSSQQADSGWACGWRNMQMLASHLLHTSQAAKDVLFAGCGYVPDISALQAWLECAWADGFDAQGAAQLGWKVQGSRRWVGTTEAAALLRYFGMRAKIVDIRGRVLEQSSSSSQSSAQAVHEGVQCDGCGQQPIRGPRFNSLSVDNYDLCARCCSADTTHGPFARLAGAGEEVSHDALMKWVWHYFSDGTSHAGLRVHTSGKPPLYFQHQGHSRTIIGIERESSGGAPADRDKDAFTLLVLDPSVAHGKLMHALGAKANWQKLMRLSMDKLSKPEYQLLHVDQGVMQETARNAQKVIAASQNL